MSHEFFGVGGGQTYREGGQHEEIRVAIDGPSGACTSSSMAMAERGPAVSHASSTVTSEPECFLDLGKARLLVNSSAQCG
ncbi:MAG TPA: hypothetical protein VHN16_15775 [Streptosporangiaceae bacterium]|nr:hypothetical protein [Streptosporangiaceae bacterium]